MREVIYLCVIIFQIISMVIVLYAWNLDRQDMRELCSKKLIIIKTNPCQVETMMEARELIESGVECDEVKVMDVSNYKIPDDVNEFSIEDNTVNGKRGKIKHYKRNSDGIFKQVEK